MKLFSLVRSVCAALFRRSQVAAEIDEELVCHIAHRADDLERSGMSRREAERRARIELGAAEKYKEEGFKALGGSHVRTFGQDLRFASRVLRKSPGFTALAVITLALSIGANAVVFSLLSSLVLRSVNVPDGKNLLQIEQADHAPSQSYPDYLDLRHRNASFEDLAAYEISRTGVEIDGTPSPAWIYESSGNYFDVLRVQPFLGRFFHASDEHGFNSAPYIVLSYSFWQSRFHADPKVAGKTVRLNRNVYTILGVAPEGFRGTELFFSPDFWAPIVNQQQLEGNAGGLTSRGARGLWIVGRLKPGIKPSQASADLNSVALSLAKSYPSEDDGLRFALAKPGLVGDMLGGPVHAFVSGLMLLAALILLAACANLGCLFSARAADRHRELSLRIALGSTRTRVMRQLLTEAMLISVFGAGVGIAGAVIVLRALSVWQPVPDIPINVPVNPDFGTYVAALAMACISALLFGMVPVRQVMKTDPYQGMKANAITQGMRRLTLRDVLLAVEIAVCAVLITCSLVAVRGMLRSLHSTFGFDSHNAIQVTTDFNMSGYPADLFPLKQRMILDAVRSIPGVTAAGYANRIPLNLGWSQSDIFSDTATDYRPTNRLAETLEFDVSPGYFEAAATTVLAGRTFAWSDTKDAPVVGVVNQEFARLVFGSEQNAVGHMFKIWGGKRVQVIGIVQDGKYKTLSESPQPAMFLCMLQVPSPDITFIVRSNHGTQELGSGLERTLAALNTGLPFQISSWDRELSTALFAARAASLALGTLGALGAMLALTGIFGIAAYTATRRLRELGIRIALGAQRKQVLHAALGRVLRLLAIGSGIGLALGLAATRLLSYIVYQASPRDPVVLVGSVVAMALIGLLAAWIPAMRALRADPLILLREE